MADSKPTLTTVNVETFIEGVADDGMRADARTLVELMQSATGEAPVMWGPSIVGFGSYHYKYDGGREGDSPIIGFSPRKAATVLYIVTGFKGAGPMLAKLGKHTTSKSCLYIKRLSDVDRDALRE